MLTLRAQPDRRKRQAAADSVAALVAGFAAELQGFPAVLTVSSYVAIGTELDPAVTNSALVGAGCRICLPVVPGKGMPLVFRRWEPGDQLIDRPFGLREPGSEADVVVPDLLLVPLLAFDRMGYRLGYGGGYYDRTLKVLRSSHVQSRAQCRAIGLAFDQQEVDVVPHAVYDERLDAIATPSGIILINRLDC
ncbi:MAG TPA: 5-formyltetrahydrofolate cyclo-ligase [Hyphomicrobiaceae bacterium]|nr:5-formyltetrahydrofolate cyclo-ligase [Hyphomicrobiaceae bacterium]